MGDGRVSHGTLAGRTPSRPSNIKARVQADGSILFANLSRGVDGVIAKPPVDRQRADPQGRRDARLRQPRLPLVEGELDAPHAPGEGENRLAGIETKLVTLDGRVSLLAWMIGFNIAMTVAVLWRVFSHGGA